MPVLVYIGAALPSLSETFVYREIAALRRQGIQIQPVSIHAPAHDLGDRDAEAVLDDVIELYSAGAVRLMLDALAEGIRRPARAGSTIALALRDAAIGRCPSILARAKVVWQAMAALALSFRTRELDLLRVHAHMANVPTSIAMYYAKVRSVPFSFTGHAADLFLSPSLLKEKLERAAFIACISEWHRSFYHSITPLADAKLPLVRCGIDIDRFQTPKRPATNDITQILAVGRLVPKKGFDTLIESIGLLKEELPKIQVTIVGGGPEQQRLVELIRERGVDSHVELLGAQANEKVRELMVRSDIFVLPCRIDQRGDRDGIPVVLMEAMACGLCAISGDLPTIRDLIQDGVNGRLVESDNPGALARAIADVIDDAAQRRLFAERGRATVVTEFSMETNVKRLMKAFGLDGKTRP